MDLNIVRLLPGKATSASLDLTTNDGAVFIRRKVIFFVSGASRRRVPSSQIRHQEHYPIAMF